MDTSVTALRVLREIAEQGTFTAAALSLGYTQSAVSRQVAALETAAGAKLFERSRGGVTLTRAGRVLLRHASAALDELDLAARELASTTGPTRRIRLGAFVSAGAVLVPRALIALRRTNPDLQMTTREGTTPALVRALRAGTLDLAVLAARPPFRTPDAQTPALVTTTISESELMLAVAASHPFATRESVHVDELRRQSWVATRSGADETLLGVWPGLAEQPPIAHTARDWLTKLQLVAAGCGVTTVSGVLAPVLPDGVRLVAVHGGPAERRRLLVARMPHARRSGLAETIDAIRAAAAGI